MHTRWIGIGAVWGALAVVLGAFGAHAIRESVSAAQMDWWETAVLYHALHALAIVLYGLFRERAGGRNTPGTCFLVGSIIFSGSLYAMTLTGARWLGMVTPVGGLLLIAGWAGFAWQAFRAPTRP